MNIAGRLSSDLQPRALNIGFILNGFETHTLVQFWDTDLQRWMLLDPTFDLTVVRASDGTWATAEDMQAATLNQAWTSMNYQFLGAWGDSIAKAYYLDYPLLYLNVPPFTASGPDPMPYLVQQSALPIEQPGLYYVQCSGSTTLVVDGVLQQVACNQIDSLSLLYIANSITSPAGSTSNVEVYSPVRNAFPALGLSVLTAPANGARVSPQNIQFTWTAVPGASYYVLRIGSTPGAQDVLIYSTFSTSNPSGTTSTIASLQPSVAYYATLWTVTSKGWTSSASTFHTRVRPISFCWQAVSRTCR
jgi:hypothetical protein